MHGHARRQSRQAEGEGRNVGAIRKLRDHAVAFATVNGGLIALNLATSPDYFWALWPLFGWGIGFVSHAASIYNALRVDRAQGPSLAVSAPSLALPAEAERERPWPDLEER